MVVTSLAIIIPPPATELLAFLSPSPVFPPFPTGPKRRKDGASVAATYFMLSLSDDGSAAVEAKCSVSLPKSSDFLAAIVENRRNPARRTEIRPSLAIRLKV
ncbi:hypothetical protein PS1_023324 [Malus domestica]